MRCHYILNYRNCQFNIMQYSRRFKEVKVQPVSEYVSADLKNENKD